MKFIYTLVALFLGLALSAQMDILDSVIQKKKGKEYVAYTFKTSTVVTAHSVEMCKKHALDFRITHRFGDIAATNADNIHTLFGFDQAQDIGILFDYGVTDDLTVGTSRMKGAGDLTELWSLNIKYRILKQTKDFKTPVTITLFGNTVISSELSSGDPSTINYFPSNNYHGFSNRLTYLAQSMIATKATDWLSIQLSPTFLWRNNVAYNDKNGMFALGLLWRAKFNQRMCLIFEYFTPIRKQGVDDWEFFPMLRGIKNSSTTTNINYPDLEIGLEFETGGHVFHVNFSNTAGILENDFLAYNPHNWLQGQFRLGFDISRTFQLDKKGGKYWKKGSIEEAN